MVLDPASALGVASSLIQILDFTRKLITKTHSIYTARKDGQVKRQELEAISNNLSQLNDDMKTSLEDARDARMLTFEEEKLVSVCMNVGRVSGELRRAVDDVKSNSRCRAWKCFREALNVVWDERKINDMTETLARHRAEIDTFILAFLRKRIDDVLNVSQSVQSQLHLLSEKQDGLSSALLGFVDESRAWQAELIDRIHQHSLQAYVENSLVGGQIPNIRDIQSVSGALSRAADKARKDSLNERLLGRLQFPAIRERVHRIPQAESTTFNWVFDPNKISKRYFDNFAEWLLKGDGIYWITGKPASGKSTLMKFLQNSKHTQALLEQWANNSPQYKNACVRAGYFFWKAGHGMQKTQRGLLQTLMHDLLSQQPCLFPTVFPERWKRCMLFGDDPSPWSWDELHGAFFDYIRRSRSSVFLIIDGLDECEDDYGALIDLLQGAAVGSERTKICLGSRPEPKFQDAFRRYPSFRMQDLTLPDILSFVSRRLCANPRFIQLQKREPQHAADLVVSITQRSSGVFLWVNLVVRSLLDGLGNSDRIQDLRRRLNCIPPELDDLYSSIISNLDPFYLEHASQIFQLVQTAPEVLTLLDLSFVDEYDEQSCFKTDVRPLQRDESRARCQDVVRRISSRCKGFIEASTTEDIETPPRAQEPEIFDVIKMANALGDDFWNEDPSESLGDSRSGNSFHNDSSNALTVPEVAIPRYSAFRAARRTRKEGEISWDFCAACKFLQEEPVSEICIGSELSQCGWNTRTLGYSGKVSSHLYDSMMWTMETRRRLGLMIMDRDREEGKKRIAALILKLHDLQRELEKGNELPRNLLGDEWFAYSWMMLPPPSRKYPRMEMMQQHSLPGGLAVERVMTPMIGNGLLGPLYVPLAPHRGLWYNAGAPPPEPLCGVPYVEQSESQSPDPTTFMGWYHPTFSGNSMTESEILKSTEEAMYKPDTKAITLKQLHHSAAYQPITAPEVDYLHRTAKDFIERPENWNKMVSVTKSSSFNPSVSLLRSAILSLKRLPDSHATITKFWVLVRWCMTLAARSDKSGDPSSVRHIDEVNHAASTVFKLYQEKFVPQKGREISRHASSKWVSSEPGNAEEGANFISLAVKYDLVNYVRAKRNEGIDVTHDDNGRPMLDYAFFSEQPFQQDGTMISKTYKAPSISMIRTLLEDGANPNEWSDQATPWLRALRKLSEFQSVTGLEPQDLSKLTQQWYDIFSVFIEAGADPKADYNSPKGSYAREVFEPWDAVKAEALQKLIRKRQNKLPRWGRKLFQNLKAVSKPK